MATDWTIMDDIEESMFDDCPKDNWNRYVMPDDYCSWRNIDEFLVGMDDETTKKLIDDYGIFKVIKEFRREKGYYAFEDNVDDNDDNHTDVYRILAEFIITMWIVDMDMVSSEMNLTEYEEQERKEKEEEEAEEQKEDSDDDDSDDDE